MTQLENGTAVLFSTYHNDKIEVTLSISVDGDKKSYIVIDTADSSSNCIWIFIYTFFAAWVKKLLQVLT